ncbi:hypothetical protein KXD40_004300 [Peronospora effusa]|uniref:Phosphatidylinositol-specific phospholipase C X domain-containing protein n=1 Tax=Peronospora effusa TaxID=542832 RepID=A0A3M6VHS4_9STRA|nr:hypothetical protein DD238_004143 [Peronospora effusa]UIZ27887.1 hypothetical protein KXD40_004300 [Peronospora effusa]CAI5701104.1 unnamed protein product [Peronospora effusa]
MVTSCNQVASSILSTFNPHFFTTFLLNLLILLALYTSQAIANVLPLQDSMCLELDMNPDTFWALSTSQIAQDSTQFKSQILDVVPDLVPFDVKCDKMKRCDQKGICAIVCKHGSVQMEKWLQKALHLQRKLAYRRNICSATLPGTHNSAINLADGYGVEDHVFEGYLRYFSWFKKGMKVHTNDQFFSLTDQLNMGVRFIELDMHWFDGDLHIAHCGGFKSKLLDKMIEVFNDIAKILGTGIEWDSETIGCKPSLSSIPTKEQRPLEEALSEVATWLHAPEHVDEFLMVFFDDETNLMKWNKVGMLLDYLKKYFPEEEILRPIELVYETKWPTFEELLRAGKRVLFMSGADYLTQGEELLFVKDTICNWQEPPLPLTPFPECRFNHSDTDIGIPDENFTIFRPETSEIEYGFLNANGQIGYNKYLLNEESLPGVADCGVNMPSPDNLTPKRMEATVWTVTKGHELDASKCVALMRKSKSWQSVDCQAANLVPACVDMKNPRLWQLGSVSVVEADAASACSALSASELKYSAPASGYENELLRSQLIEHAPRSIAGVWLNAKAFVSEVATVAQQLKVSPIDDIISVE